MLKSLTFTWQILDKHTIVLLEIDSSSHWYYYEKFILTSNVDQNYMKETRVPKMSKRVLSGFIEKYLASLRSFVCRKLFWSKSVWHPSDFQLQSHFMPSHKTYHKCSSSTPEEVFLKRVEIQDDLSGLWLAEILLFLFIFLSLGQRKITLTDIFEYLLKKIISLSLTFITKNKTRNRYKNIICIIIYIVSNICKVIL